MLLQVFFLLLSFVVLYFGAEWTLNSAEKVGEFFDLSDADAAPAQLCIVYHELTKWELRQQHCRGEYFVT